MSEFLYFSLFLFTFPFSPLFPAYPPAFSFHFFLFLLFPIFHAQQSHTCLELPRLQSPQRKLVSINIILHSMTCVCTITTPQNSAIQRQRNSKIWKSKKFELSQNTHKFAVSERSNDSVIQIRRSFSLFNEPALLSFTSPLSFTSRSRTDAATTSTSFVWISEETPRSAYT